MLKMHYTFDFPYTAVYTSHFGKCYIDVTWQSLRILSQWQTSPQYSYYAFKLQFSQGQFKVIRRQFLMITTKIVTTKPMFKYAIELNPVRLTCFRHYHCSYNMMRRGGEVCQRNQTPLKLSTRNNHRNDDKPKISLETRIAHWELPHVVAIFFTFCRIGTVADPRRGTRAIHPPPPRLVKNRDLVKKKMAIERRGLSIMFLAPFSPGQ